MRCGFACCCDIVSRLFFALACVQICVLSFRKWDAVEPFCWHPPIMTVAVLIVYQEGVRIILRPTYRSHFLRLGREWSQYLQVPLTAQDTYQRRQKYGILLGATFVLLLVGAACAAWSKYSVGISVFWPLTNHAIFGLCAIVLLGLHGIIILARQCTNANASSHGWGVRSAASSGSDGGTYMEAIETREVPRRSVCFRALAQAPQSIATIARIFSGP